MPKAILMSLLLVLCGCATPESGNLLTEENVSQNASRINVQQTTREQVRDLLGNPAKVVEYSNLQREVWDYPYGQQQRLMVLSVQFSRDGVAREVLNMTDPSQQMNNHNW